MGKLTTSVFDTIKANETARTAEIAASNVKRQEMMAMEGKLQEVSLCGPHEGGIPAFFRADERAFYPVFNKD